MRIRTALRLPKEHGAWGMLYVPLACGALVAGAGGWRVLLLALATTFLFVARESILAIWRARARQRDPGTATRLAVIYLVLAGAAGSPLLVVWDLHGMVPLGIAAAGLLVWNAARAAKREERTVAAELIGIAGLTLTAPAAHYVALTVWTSTALWLWLLNALYFGSSVFFVKLRVASAHSKSPREVDRIRTECSFYHWVIAVLLVVVPGDIRFRLLLTAAYLPIILRAILHLLRPVRTLDLKRVGLLEIVYSLLFLVFAVQALRAGF